MDVVLILVTMRFDETGTCDPSEYIKINVILYGFVEDGLFIDVIVSWIVEPKPDGKLHWIMPLMIIRQVSRLFE